MKRKILGVLAVFLAVLLTGCVLDPAESLFMVPQQPRDYYKIQKAIERYMPPGASYAPPASGENQQAVQMVDLDGDKSDEAIVYLKTGGETPLGIYVFDETGGEYTLAAKVDLAGSAFDRVLYARVDDRPGNEIIIGRRVSNQVDMILCVYTLQSDGLGELMRAGCEEYLTVDLDGDERQGIFLLDSQPESSHGVAEYYHWKDKQLLREREASITTEVSAVKRIITGKMCREVPAVFVAAEYGEGSIVTDIFGLRGGEFCNLTHLDDTDTAVQTVREYYVYSNDIDADGLIELPRLYPMRTVPEDDQSRNQKLIGWYNLQLDGSEVSKCITYHNYSDGWYLEVEPGWIRQLAVTRSGILGNAKGYCFLWPQEDRDVELFTIAATASSPEAVRASKGGWEVITQKGEITYACHLGEAAAAMEISLEDVQEMFHFIQVDWNTGET